MNRRFVLANAMFALALFVTSGLSQAEGTGKLAAPIYPGSVPAVPADGINADPGKVLAFDGGKTLNCYGTSAGGDFDPQWCFLTKDPIEKVRAFYEKAVGKMLPVHGDNGIHGYQVFAERVWTDSIGEEQSAGLIYNGVSVHALPSPPVKGQAPKAPAMGDDSWAGQEDFGFYAQTRFFGGFLDAVDMFGDPSKRPVSDLDKLYSQRNKLESAIFQRKGASLDAVDATLSQRYMELRGQRQQAAHSGMMDAYMQHGAQGAQLSAGPTAEEDARFNAVMAGDPALQQRYVELTQKSSQLMQQGKFDEADELLAELEELEASHPELAAMSGQQQARAASISATQKAGEEAIQARGENQLDKAIWGTGLEMLDALDKEAYYTLIVIDGAFVPSDRDYSRDRKIIEAETAGWIPHQNVGLFGVNYPNAGAAIVDSKDQVEEEKKEGVGDKLKKGFGKLKGLRD